jgi:hypothetical protein
MKFQKGDPRAVSAGKRGAAVTKACAKRDASGRYVTRDSYAALAAVATERAVETARQA